MYINADPDAGTADAPGHRRPDRAAHRDPRHRCIELWEAARRDLEAAGAEVVEVDFPVVSNYEGDRAGRADDRDARARRRRVPATREIVDLSAWAWDDFLARQRRPGAARARRRRRRRGSSRIPTGALPDRYTGFDDDIAEYPERARDASGRDVRRHARARRRASRGLEETRRIDLEEWMDGLGLDAVVFPAVADVGPADMDVNEASADLGWRNGVWVANGNLVPRHLGIPTVTVPMGTMADIGMPVGLTFAGRAYDDTRPAALAAAFEATGSRRTAPPRTPAARLTPALG